MNGWFALLAFVCGFALAQIWKFCAALVRNRKSTQKTDLKALLSYLMQSGGMPSGHAASMTALTTYLGITGGFNTGLFALAAATTLIVIYDAIHVRYAVGEQGEALNRLLVKNSEKPLRIVAGHTLPQVIAGVLIGIIIGVMIGIFGKV